MLSFIIIILFFVYNSSESSLDVVKIPDPMDATVLISFLDGDRVKECSAVLVASKSRKILVTAGHCMELYLRSNEKGTHFFSNLTSNSSPTVVKDTEINESPCFVNLPDGSKSFCQRMVLHEKYKNVGQMLTWNDIVVIKMDKAIMTYNKKSLDENSGLVTFNITPTEMVYLPEKENTEITYPLKIQGYGKRNSITTQDWTEFIGQHKGIHRCITNGKGPSKFQNCRRSWIFNGQRYYGCVDGARISPNLSFFLKNDLCKKFHVQNNGFWNSEPDKTQKNVTSNSGNSSRIEIFSVEMTSDKNKTSPSNFQHLLTCFDPKILHDTSKPKLNWCATAPSYKDILKEKTITRVEEIGVCPEWCGLNNSKIVGYESMSLEEPQLFPKVYCEKIWTREYERLTAVNTNQMFDEESPAKILCTGNYRKVEYRSFKYSDALGEFKIINETQNTSKYINELYSLTSNGEIMEASRLCLGDSGSGLISYNENLGKLILHGIYILTTGLCGGRDEASFFLDIKQYTDWINMSIHYLEDEANQDYESNKNHTMRRYVFSDNQDNI